MFFLCIGVIITSLIGCKGETTTQTANSTEDEVQGKNTLAETIDKSNLLCHIRIEWDKYNSAEEIVDASSNVFVGKVDNIYFEVYDVLTGQIDRSPSSTSENRYLTTNYTIRVLDNYKGETEQTVTLRITGGIPSRIEEQQALCREAGIIRSILIGELNELTLGETYLFCTYRFNDYYKIINMDQFSYPVDSPEAEEIRQACGK